MPITSHVAPDQLVGHVVHPPWLALWAKWLPSSSSHVSDWGIDTRQAVWRRCPNISDYLND